MMWLANLVFGDAKWAKFGMTALVVGGVIIWWQLDRASARANGERVGRLEERLKATENVNENISKVRNARDRVLAADRLQPDPFVRSD